MKCPMCGKPTVAHLRPFCSTRCANLDLARWLNGSYAVPSSEDEDQGELDQALEEARDAQSQRKPH